MCVFAFCCVTSDQGDMQSKYEFAKMHLGTIIEIKLNAVF